MPLIKSTQKLFQIQNSTSMTMQIKKLKVETERQALLGDCQLLFLEMLYLQYINLLEDLISTMVIFYMINKPNKENFQNKLEKVQYRACLSITGAIQGTSRTKLYDELGLHSLIKRRQCNKLIFFYKIVNGLLCLFIFRFPLSNKLFLKIRIIFCY